ncbi:MAG: hypothetical protein KDE24_32320 [Caldilinea sp.]|nr:hypothetical protein [Caldilinea sp.]
MLARIAVEHRPPQGGDPLRHAFWSLGGIGSDFAALPNGEIRLQYGRRNLGAANVEDQDWLTQ